MAGPADGLFPQAVLIVTVCLGALGQEHPLAAPQGRQLATYDLEKALDRLADIVREHSDMETIYQSMGLK